MPSGLDILDGKVPVANAPNSNLAPFDVKVPKGADPAELAGNIVEIGSVKSGLDLLDASIPKPTVVKDKEPPPVNVDSYNPEALFGKVISRGIKTNAEVPKSQHDLEQGPAYGAALALNRLWSLAKNPYDIVKGGAEFVSSLPGFALGVGGAAWNLSKAIGQGANLDQAYEAAAKGMEENASRWSQTITEPLGRLIESPKTLGTKLANQITGGDREGVKSDSSFVGELAMAPLTAVTMAAQAVADAPWLDEYPNVRGAIRFGGDVLGLLTIGRIYKGGSAEYAKDVEPIINKAKVIEEKQKVIDTIPDEVIKTAQNKVLEVEKVQLDLEAKRLQAKLDHEKIVAEDLKVKGEEVKAALSGDKEPSPVEEVVVEQKSVLPLNELKQEEPVVVGPEAKVGVEGGVEPVRLYRSGEPRVTKGSWGEGYYFTKNPLEASAYGKRTGEKLTTYTTDMQGIVDITKEADKLLKSKKAKNITEAKRMVAEKYPDAEGYSYDGLNKELLIKNPERFKQTDIREELDRINKFTEPVKSGVEILEPKKAKVEQPVEIKSKRGKSTITYSRGGAETHSMEVGGTFVGDKFVAVDEGTIAFGKAEKTYGVYKDGVQIKGGFDKASEAIKFAKENKEITKPVEQPQPITDLDLQTGTPLPEKLSPHNHPFRDKDLEHTNTMRKLMQESINKRDVSPEMFTRYLINEANIFLNGKGKPTIEEIAKFEKVRNGLSELAVRAENLRAKFDKTEDFDIFVQTVREAARWARNADRPKPSGGTTLNMGIDPIEAFKQAKKFLYGDRVVTLTGREKQSGPNKMLQYFYEWTKEDNKMFKDAWGGKERPSEDKGQYGWAPEQGLKDINKGGTQLNMMIPINEAPEIVKGLLKNIKVVAEGIFRNKDIFDKTGYWLGKDRKWRYEIGDEGLILKPELLKTGIGNQAKLSTVISHPTLFEAVPELKDIYIGLNKHMNSEGRYIPEAGVIEVKIANKDTIVHEVQHAVNDIMGSRFRGSNVEVENVKIQKRILDDLRRAAKTDEIKQAVEKIAADYDAGKINNVGNKIFETMQKSTDPTERAALQDVLSNHIVSSERPFENYMKDPGEMEARLTSKRLNMTPEQRKAEPPWITLDKMLEDENITTKILGDTSIGRTLYMGIDPTQIKRMFKGFHGTSDKYIKPSDIVGKYLEPKTLKRIVEDTLDELKLFGDERRKAKEQIYSEEYFDTAINPKKYDMEEGDTRPFDKKGEIYAAKEFEDAAEYAEWAGEAYDNVLIALGALDENPIGLAKKAKDIYDKNRSATPYVLEVEFDRPLKEGDNVTSNPVKVTGVYDQKGIKLFSGVDPTQIPEVAKTIISLYKSAKRKSDESRGMKEWKPGPAADRLKKELVRSFVDRSGNIRKDLLDSIGQDGYEIVQKMYLSKGASSLAAQQLKQMRKEVYDGLSKKEKVLLDDTIFHTRILDIAKYKTPKQFKELEKYIPAESVAFLEAFQHMENISPERAHEIYHVREDGSIGGRAGAYFEWMKKPLKDMLDAELISQVEYDALSTHNYRRLKVVDVFDKRNQSKVGKTIKSVYDSGVESLAHGRDTTVFERSAEVMALEVFNRAYGRILNNAANKTLLDLARTQKDNPFVAVKDSPKDHVPSGWDRIFVYEKGERKAIYISPEMAKEWITNSPEMSYKLSQFIRYASGSPVLRTFATGIDWGFALANLPRDIMHIWYASRVFEGGEWKPLYNSNMPVFALQMGKDIEGVFNDAMLRKGRYQDYIKEGGGMEFLVHQGRLMQRGRHIEGNLDKVQNFLGYFGETSEIVTRLAVRDRVIKRRAAEQGLTYEEALLDKKITQEATFAARDYMDFGQGGGISKALDNGLPYLNASIQGTRGLFRAFKDNPVESTYKLAQFAALVTGLYIANQSLNPQTMESLKGNIDMQGNLVIPLGDGFGFDDEKGQRRYPYIKIPLDPGQKFFKTFFEAAYDKATGQTVDVNAVTNSLSQISPVSISSLPPTVSGTLGYMYNKDFWLNDEIWKKTDKSLNWPQSKEEYIPGKTPQAFIDIGAVTGLSPERLKYALSELVTSGSPWSWLVGQGYDAAFHDLPQNKKEMHLAEALSKTPIFKRFIGITNPYSQFAAPIQEARDESMMKRWIENRGLDQRVESFLYEGGKRAEVIDYINSTAKDLDTRDRLKERFIFQEKIKGLPNRAFWLSLKGIPDTEARAEVFVQRFDSASSDEREQMNKEIGVVVNAGGVISDEFKQEVMKVRDKKARGMTK